MSSYLDIKYIQLLSSTLRNFKRKSDSLWNCSCPICGDSEENKKKARGYILKKSNRFFYFCHNCKASMSFGNFLKSQNQTMFDEYCLERFKDHKVNGRDAHKTVPESKKIVEKSSIQKDIIKLPKISDLPDMHPAKISLNIRKIPFKYLSNLYYTDNFKEFVMSVFPDVDYSNLIEDARIVIPFFDREGNLFAFQGRSIVATKIRYISVKANEEIPLIYGLNKWNPKKETYVVEGPFDSMFLDNCLAATGSDLCSMINRLKKSTGIETKDLTYIFDNESRNKQIVSLIKKAIDSNYRVVIFPDSVESCKDINDMILKGHDVKQIIQDNTYSGLSAEMEFNKWKKC